VPVQGEVGVRRREKREGRREKGEERRKKREGRRSVGGPVHGWTCAWSVSMLLACTAA
jgi:hypothetical protein